MAELSRDATPRPAGQAGARSAYLIEPERDLATIRGELNDRRMYAAYALGQLDPAYVGLTEWWTAKGNTGRALVLFSRGGLGDALFCAGERQALEAILEIHQGPRLTYAMLQPEHLDTVKRHFLVLNDHMMSRMAVTAETFHPFISADGSRVFRMHAADVRALNRLYATEGGAPYYNSAHVIEGVYYGLTQDDRLVAAAGTHVVGREEGIAVVGNVFTHPEYRGRGYAKAVTSAVTAELLNRCRDVVLTVDPDNLPAVRAYRTLGYEHVCYLIESAAVRKEPTGLLSLIRRTIARRRGRRYNGEVVLSAHD